LVYFVNSPDQNFIFHSSSFTCTTFYESEHGMNSNNFKLGLGTLASSFMPIASAALYSSPVSTDYGLIQGYPAFSSSPSGNLTNWQNIAVWKNIPFAATTAGNNRWRAPQPASPWNVTLDAKDFGNTCPGSSSNTDYVVSKDCLNLNI
jgi:carboxylesterase 2